MTSTLRKFEMHGVFKGTEAIGAGVLTVKQLRGKQYTRLFRDVYLPAGYRQTHALRCEGSALVVPERAVLTGRSAAAVLGVDMTRPTDNVEWLAIEGLHVRMRGIVVKRTPLTPADWRPGEFCRIASPARMAFDLARVSNLRNAVSYLDAAIRVGLVSAAELQRYCVSRREHGVCKARAAAALADGRAESLPESELRVVLTLGGFEVTPQVQVSDQNGKVVARVDLAVDGYKVAIEYDGTWHTLREQLERDRVRLRRLRDAEWDVVHVTAKDLSGDPAALCDAVRRACARAAHRA